jgi:hypothetical protein
MPGTQQRAAGRPPLQICHKRSLFLSGAGSTAAVIHTTLQSKAQDFRLLSQFRHSAMCSLTSGRTKLSWANLYSAQTDECPHTHLDAVVSSSCAAVVVTTRMHYCKYGRATSHWIGLLPIIPKFAWRLCNCVSGFRRAQADAVWASGKADAG